MTVKDCRCLLDKIDVVVIEEYNKQALDIKGNVDMPQESMFCDENGKPLPRKNKFDMTLYEAKAGIQEDVISLRIENEVLKAEVAKLKEKLKEAWTIIYASGEMKR